MRHRWEPLTAIIVLALTGSIGPVWAAEVSPGAVTVTFAATNPELAVYRKGAKVTLHSASAQVEDTAERRLLNLYFSDLENVDCQTAGATRVKGSSFVLRLTVYLPAKAALAPGKQDDLGIMFTTAAGLYFKVGSVGSVTIRQTLPAVTGTLALVDDNLKVAGDFTARLCK
ncbi:MAG: hypothetical protein PHX83_15165 [Acidobacteriia bacterium]|nr:hypothetical protein [Terriglobia bacterium]